MFIVSPLAGACADVGGRGRRLLQPASAAPLLLLLPQGRVFTACLVHGTGTSERVNLYEVYLFPSKLVGNRLLPHSSSHRLRPIIPMVVLTPASLLGNPTVALRLVLVDSHAVAPLAAGTGTFPVATAFDGCSRSLVCWNRFIEAIPCAKKVEAEAEDFHVDRVSADFSRALQQARMAKKLTQAQLAQAINEKTSVIVEYESGKAIPNGAVVQKLNRELGVKLPKAKEKRKPVE
ncbi:UNVERIFIED_CONTAM: hypothetical protein H355_009225 [Colinus virginianus]|nr:hypothetical protein H355_009225 [Colinus virginianus]